MKDFIFSDPSESTAVVTFRTDAIGDANNFTVHQITGLNIGTDIPYWDQQKKVGLLTFGKRETTKKALIDYATANQLDLVMRDSNGLNSVILVDWNSDAGTDSW